MKLTAPKYLDTVAKDYWKRHAQALHEAGTLTERNVDSFALTCRVWSLMASTDPHADSKSAMKFNGLLKHFLSLAKPFGLIPSKPPTGVKPQTITDVLNEKMGYA